MDDEDKMMGVQNVTPSIIDNLGREQYPTWINESGVYALVFASQLPTAKHFKRWVTSEVLPSIRRHGLYATPLTAEQMLADPGFAAYFPLPVRRETYFHQEEISL